MHLKYIFITCLTISLSLSDVSAQDSTGVKRKSIFRKGMIGRVVTDGSNTFSTIVQTYARPLHWQKRDFARLGGALLISGAAMLADEKVYHFMQRHQNKTFDTFEEVGDFLGQPEHNYPFMLVVWASGVVTNTDWLRDTGIMVIASVTTSGLIQTLSKEAVGRSRPESGRGAFDYKPFGGGDYHSFPSGHTMLSVATSWVLARQVNFVPLKVVFYALPVITGASRVYVGAHWLSDILLGSALGIACAESVVRLYPLIKEKNKVAFSLTPTGNGLSMVVKF